MKKMFLTFSVMLAAISVACADEDRPIEVEKLPEVAQQFLKQYFPKATVSFAKVDRDIAYKDYEVMLTDGSRVEFRPNGEWQEVDCKFGEVPDGIVPEPIIKYIEQNYPGAKVKQIDRERRVYEVSLSNRLELKFDQKFNLIEIDD